MKIYCISHLPNLAISKSCTTPIFVGNGDCPDGWIRDNSLKNISNKNPNYCELTAQYWIWKNIFNVIGNKNLIGFCHYRRFFLNPLDVDSRKKYKYEFFSPNYYEFLEGSFSKDGIDCVIPQAEYLQSLSLKGQMLNLRKISSRYYWGNKTIFYHYDFFHELSDLRMAIDLMDLPLQEGFESYLKSSESLTPYNMIIARKSFLDEYFSILFPWLLRCEEKLDVTSYSPYQKRVFGFLAERFFSFYFSSLKFNLLRLPIGHIDA